MVDLAAGPNRLPGMAIDPLPRFHRWFAQARRSGLPQPEAMALCTADRRGRTSSRMVLLKEADARGFVFFTNARSRKGRELAANPHASLLFWWDPLGRQVRIEGRVEAIDAAAADAYWATRPRASQLAALASAQSAPIASRAALLARWRALGARYRGRAVPRPAHWTGFRVVPASIEFWTHGANRLHDRERFARRGRRWTVGRLQP